MKFTLAFKTPDVLDSISENIDTFCETHKWDGHDKTCADCRERKQEAKYEADEAKEALSKFIEFGEYVRIEFDTDAGTATVVPLRK